MSEGDPGPVDAGSGGSFWTSFPAILTASAVLLGAIVSAVVALRDDEDDAGTATTQVTTSPAGTEHFVAVTRPGGRVYFEDETMFVKASEPARPMLVLAEGDEPLRDLGMSARTKWVSGAKDYGIGFVCRYANAGNYYLLSVLSKGRYHIVRYRKGKSVSLTGGIQTSGAIRGDVNEIGVRCVGSDPVILTLIVGGQEVRTVRDPTGIGDGNVGIRVGTSESVVTCSFQDFELRSL